MKSYDAGLQSDVAIPDFSKAFDTVPHNKLLHKLDDCGVRGSINRWLEIFLTQRKMKVVIDGDESVETTVDTGVPQGTVLGPHLFLCHSNDLPDSVRSSVRLFAGDSLLYRNIRTQQDHTILQEDLQKLEVWAKDWGMRLNAKICYILSIKKRAKDTTIRAVTSYNRCKITHTLDYIYLMILNGQHTSPMLPRMTTTHSAFLEETLNTVPKTARKQHTSP
jgi:hypothetical protein